MTGLDLDAIRERVDAATPGPWVSEYSAEQGNCILPHDAQSTREAVAVTRLYHQQADAEFIAHARTDVPALLDEVERLTAAHEDGITRRSHDRADEDAMSLARTVDRLRLIAARAADVDGLARVLFDQDYAHLSPEQRDIHWAAAVHWAAANIRTWHERAAALSAHLLGKADA